MTTSKLSGGVLIGLVIVVCSIDANITYVLQCVSQTVPNKRSRHHLFGLFRCYKMTVTYSYKHDFDINGKFAIINDVIEDINYQAVFSPYGKGKLSLD